MREVDEGIFVGDISDCRVGAENDFAVIHACKFPCHAAAAGYTSRISKDDPHYLQVVKEHDLYLNLIDAPKPLFYPESFKMFLNFAADTHKHRDLLIHCNQGLSRAPSLALFLLAHEGFLPNESYAAAREEYVKRDPMYTPGMGIQMFLTFNWDYLHHDM